HRPAEVGAVGELVQEAGDLLLGGREAHVDHVETLLDGPAQAGQKHEAAALKARSEDADAVEAALGRERANDPGAPGSVPAQIAFGVLLDDRLVVVAAPDRDRAVELAHERVTRLDAAVEDADAHALAGRPAPGP